MARRGRWLCALVLAVLAIGCKDRRLVQLENVRAEVCRCKDAACVNSALARMPTAGPKRERAAQRVAADILDCVAKVGLQPAEEEAPPTSPGEPAGPAELPAEEPAEAAEAAEAPAGGSAAKPAR